MCYASSPDSQGLTRVHGGTKALKDGFQPVVHHVPETGINFTRFIKVLLRQEKATGTVHFRRRPCSIGYCQVKRKGEARIQDGLLRSSGSRRSKQHPGLGNFRDPMLENFEKIDPECSNDKYSTGNLPLISPPQVPCHPQDQSLRQLRRTDRRGSSVTPAIYSHI